MAPLSAALTRPNSGTAFRPALTLGVLLAAVPLLPFASLLKATTHHRPLAGVTFAVVAGLVIVLGALLANRLIALSGRQTAVTGRLSRLALIALAALGTAALLVSLVHALRGHPGDGYRTGLFDALRVLALATLAARIPLPSRLEVEFGALGLRRG